LFSKHEIFYHSHNLLAEYSVSFSAVFAKLFAHGAVSIVKVIVQSTCLKYISVWNEKRNSAKHCTNRVSKAALGIARDKASIHLSMEKVQSYEEAFAKIQKATKITDIDQLVQTFISAEDQNFSLFNYANDLSSQIEKMEESIFTTNQEIKQYQGDGQQGDYQRKRVIEDLEHKLIQTETRASVYEERQDMAAQTTEALKEGIQALFDKLGAGSDAKIQDMLGSSGVTDSNMMQHLGKCSIPTVPAPLLLSIPPLSLLFFLRSPTSDPLRNYPHRHHHHRHCHHQVSWKSV
jgi:hypothetical protein